MGLDMFIFNKEDKEVCYWRKANSIHKYFTDNILNKYGELVRNMNEVAIDKELLQDLVETCKKVLDNPELAEELLPTNGGFFWGGCDYDEDYFNDLKYTVRVVSKIIANPLYDELYYYASW